VSILFAAHLLVWPSYGDNRGELGMAVKMGEEKRSFATVEVLLL
jgi:hypothetical protein